jgi:hypothetical protein
LAVRESQSNVHQPLLALVLRYEEMPEDFESLLTFKKHRHIHQTKADEEWAKKIEEMGGAGSDEDDDDEKPVVYE